MTFGVVVLGGYPMAHIRALQSRLLDRLGPEALASRELEIGTAAQFQGAERDVMFISMLDVPNDNGRMTAKPQEFSGRNRRFVQQLNVAVSRARDQLWVFHSFDAASLHPGDSTKQPDARLVLLQPRLFNTPTLKDELDKCDSEFERQVVRAIHTHDPQLRISTQVPALGYVIDIVVEDVIGRRIAVECDGDKYHGDPTKVRADLYRERILERAGWRFYRFFGSEWFADPDVHLAQISWLLETQQAQHGSYTTPLGLQGPAVESESVAASAPPLYLGVDCDSGRPDDDCATEAPNCSEDTDLSLLVRLLPSAQDERYASEVTTLDAVQDERDRTSLVPQPGPPTHKPTQSEPRRTAGRELTKKERNKLLAAALRARSKAADGDTWERAKALLATGLTIDEAADLA